MNYISIYLRGWFSSRQCRSYCPCAGGPRWRRAIRRSQRSCDARLGGDVRDRRKKRVRFEGKNPGKPVWLVVWNINFIVPEILGMSSGGPTTNRQGKPVFLTIKIMNLV